jgi:hypothetical protein
MHLQEDELVLHYYGEMSDADEARAAEHLSECATCHAGYRRLQQVLAIVDQASLAVPEPSAGFERTVWARLEPSLPPERRGWISWLAVSPARLAWAAAIVMLVGAAFMAGRLSPRAPQAAPEAAGNQVRERILLVDLGDHLDRSEMVLVELVSADQTAARDISAERSRAEQLVAANRLYRETAASTGDTAVVDLLDQLERVLVDVAASPSELSPRALQDVRERIESGSLLFKVQVVSSELRQRQRTAFQARTGQRSSL